MTSCRDRCDTVTVTPPKGGVCHVTNSVTDAVTGCRERKRPSANDSGSRERVCHSLVTRSVTEGVTVGVTRLAEMQLLPLARLIAGAISRDAQARE